MIQKLPGLLNAKMIKCCEEDRCGLARQGDLNDDWESFGQIVDHLESMGILEKILVQMCQEWKKDHGGFECFTYKMLHPRRFAEAICRFFQEGGK